MSEQGTTKDQVCYEPCYCKRCHGVMPEPCKYRGKNWLQLLWLRIWCALDGHGGVILLNGQLTCCGRTGYLCKRCGAIGELV